MSQVVVTDNFTQESMVVDRSDVAKAVRKWFPAMTREMRESLCSLQNALDRGEYTGAWESYLRISISPVDDSEGFGVVWMLERRDSSYPDSSYLPWTDAGYRALLTRGEAAELHRDCRAASRPWIQWRYVQRLVRSSVEE